jgi:hypothetical protein
VGVGGLERGRDSSEGALGPRARRILRGAAPGPRARRRFVRGVQWPTVLWTADVSWAVGPPLFRVAVTRSMFCDSRVCLFASYYFLKGVFSLVIRGPLWLSPTMTTSLLVPVAPALLLDLRKRCAERERREAERKKGEMEMRT